MIPCPIIGGSGAGSGPTSLAARLSFSLSLSLRANNRQTLSTQEIPYKSISFDFSFGLMYIYDQNKQKNIEPKRAAFKDN